jgi:hypothetical protein
VFGGEVLSDFISNLGTPEPAIDVSVVTTQPQGGTTSPG